MAPKGKGILAILAGGEPKGDDDESEGSESTPKGRALKAMYESMQSGKWDEAAEHFQTAYDACGMHEAEASEEESADLDEE